MPDHAPTAQPSVEPTSGLPVMVGEVEVAGGVVAVTVTADEVALVEPPALVAVTTQRIAVPIASAMTWLFAVAPGIGVPSAVHAYV